MKKVSIHQEVRVITYVCVAVYLSVYTYTHVCVLHMCVYLCVYIVYNYTYYMCVRLQNTEGKNGRNREIEQIFDHSWRV